jgi:DNA-binding response OmpR family regulator
VTSGRRILIVEDDPATRSGLAALLERRGYQTLTASSFDEAMHHLQTTGADLLITDVRLGAFNGLQLVVMHLPATPAIVVTAFDDPVLEAEAHRAGAGYLVKPIVPDRLMSLIDEKLGQGQTVG